MAGWNILAELASRHAGKLSGEKRDDPLQNLSLRPNNDQTRCGILGRVSPLSNAISQHSLRRTRHNSGTGLIDSITVACTIERSGEMRQR